VPNTRAYVLDELQQPVPVGVAGELYVGGIGLARGYWGRADLTALSFVPDALSGGCGRRLYRTGDRVRYLASGELEFLGRVDEQLKVRGFRIEPGEIESALVEEAGVRRAVVLVREDAPGDKRIVAYVEHGPQTQLDASRLREVLKRRLPDFMIPSAFVLLSTFPMTAHGKIDRRALPPPTHTEAAGPRVAPRTPLERTLLEIWTEVLGRQDVSVEDNFFELGGHSLLATQVMSRVRKALLLEVPLQSLFEEPTIAGLARGIEEKRWGDRALLSTPLLSAVDSSRLEETFPQAFAQQRLWFLEQLEPGASTYNISSAVLLRGGLDLAVLHESLLELVMRHESLRSRFALSDAGPVQIVMKDQAPSFTVTEVDAGAGAGEEQTAALIREEVLRPFDLAQGPLLRVSVLRVARDEHIVQLTIHHIVSDGWSLGVLVRELGIVYNAKLRGEASPLLPLSLRTVDFFRRQGEWLEQGKLDGQLAYWVERLAGAPALLALPTDRPRTSEQSSRGATAFVVLSSSLAERARSLGRNERASLFMVLLAGFKVLLARYSEQDDIVVGTPVANRPFEEAESLIGHLTNAVALRTQLSEELSFREVVGRVRETSLEAFSHQDVPFEKVVEQVGAERRLGKTPIFQVMFVLQNSPASPLELTGIEVATVTVPNTTTMVDLTMEVVEQPYGLVVAIQFSTDLFERRTVARMLHHYERILEVALVAPDTRLSELSFLSEAEYEETVRACNRSDGPAPKAGILHRRFEEQVRRTPHAPALVVGECSLSYEELDHRANQLAHHLRALGVTPESRVGVCLSRSEWLVVSILAVLKAGAAYVPLDPAYPAERVRYFLEDSQARVVLSDTTLEAFRAQIDVPGLRWEFIDEHASELRQLAQTPPVVNLEPEGLAYVIYTSGSTGRPKGVMIEHRNATTFLDACNRLFRDDELQTVLASTSICFDLSVFELFGPLCRGGTVHLAANAFDAAPDQSLTLINTVPSIMTDLLRFGRIPTGLRTVNLAGEALPTSLVLALRARLPGVRVLNLYGPSEDTTYSTWFEVPAQLERAPSIGRPLAGGQAYVLGPKLTPQPVGVPGEIYLGGLGLSRGYLGNPGLTAQSFIPDPFGGSLGSRLYRTGDRGRLRPDGNIEFMGRRDTQVKLHGCRIELGEIESLLRERAEVEQATVVVRDDEEGENRLVGYVVLKPGPIGLDETKLIAFLRTRLPEYMVPSRLISLEALPTTASGKIDRNALPAFVSSAAVGAVPFAEPSSAAERVLATIWCAFLEVERVGLHDSFFTLGGHSLLATQILSRVRRVLQVEVPLRRFFEDPTLSGLLRTSAELIGGREVVEQIADTYLRVMELSEASLTELLANPSA
jgi:amino acid adenylation domain-containing protein